MKFDRTLLFISLWLFSQVTLGHAMGSSFLHLTETSPSIFSQRWVPAKQIERLSLVVEPQYPQHCFKQGPVVDCGDDGLLGDIHFENLPLHADVVVRIEWLNGGKYTQAISGQTQSIQLTAADIGVNSRWQVLTTYMVIGIEHILLGLDHLLFVAGLVLLVGFQRQLIWTITAFTLAHSLTLALSVTQVVTVSQTPVEIIIALSILLVAAESLDKRITLARRYPWLVAFVFGLVHGLGFAGALREVGLPEHELPLSLLTFNLGVEFGQLGVILGLYLITSLIKRLYESGKLLRPVTLASAYVIGILGAYWSISRSAELINVF
ncbi:HupE/UreJ family protein [Candidatus Thiodiazotropha sp. CDECU1]|uniref:HupE/UreJ family protein n=1 Tax=Candidatus Thiodiazotropha sp. CDECU1 TaxID=3065865 RepID=UPI0029302C39|nr:HupE/UreJ family protein [Candidatus Thiodiazotropha sp. CDECU1]